MDAKRPTVNQRPNAAISHDYSPIALALRSSRRNARAFSPMLSSRENVRSWRSLLVLLTTAYAFKQTACSHAAFTGTRPSKANAPMYGGFVTAVRATLPIIALQAKDGGKNDASEIDLDSLFMERFKRRREEVHERTMQKEWRRPPNPFLNPYELLVEVLDGLRRPETHDPQSGVNVLLRASTESWRDTLRRSVGAPTDSDDDSVALALLSALGRRNNQFGILVTAPDAEEYVVSFPSEALDYGDGTCWVECRLRGVDDDALLVVMGWSLQKRHSDGAWLVEAIDWQDFRDSYRPGIGREEWERICG
mmetsp:Transcript_27686/g.81366  ORF Transcript_27686/g.81366 Transcript_27686/m.81366 type:complete len:307 (-) Transcript_27686:37-957(-)